MKFLNFILSRFGAFLLPRGVTLVKFEQGKAYVGFFDPRLVEAESLANAVRLPGGFDDIVFVAMIGPPRFVERDVRHAG